MENIAITEDMLNRSVLNYGNPYRLLKLFEKAAKGEKITFVVLGGSITQGSNAGPEKCYGARLAGWLKDSFFDAEIKYVNAGIGATGSLIGVHRLDRDVLCHNPDFVIVEYSVNDVNSEQTVETYDNLLYKILNHKTKPALLCIGMVSKVGSHAADSHLPVSKHYDIPFISYQNAVWPEIEKGNLTWDMLSDDDVHPIEVGHKIVADLVINYLSGLKSKNINNFTDNVCEKPFVSTEYINGRIYQIEDITADSMGCFYRDKVNLNTIPFGWTAKENGTPLEIEFKDCKQVFVMLKRFKEGGKAIISGLDSSDCIETKFDAHFTYYSSHLICKTETPTNIRISITPKLENDEMLSIAGFLVS